MRKGGFSMFSRQEYRLVVFVAAIFGVSTVLVALGHVAAQQKWNQRKLSLIFLVRQSALSQPASFLRSETGLSVPMETIKSLL